MCGIAAIFGYGEAAPPVDRGEVLRMREQMFSRGPDGRGEWFSDDGRVGFGHRRLSIIDLSPAGAQPMWNADRTLAIVFNGEIYNYAELRQKLSGENRRFHSHCDTEVLLELYATRGENMLSELRGMYAFAIWDARKEGIFLARDPFGIKPLYYSDNGHTFRIASQVKPLRDSGKIDLVPEPAGHVGYFLWGHVPDPYTMYRRIRSLPAGSSMWIDRHGPRRPKKFCDITAILREAEYFAPQPALSKSERAERLRSALAETVRFHLVADVPVGVFLSSGLDSTTIAALAAGQGGNLRTATLGFEEYRSTEADETPLAEQFAERCGASHQTIWVSRGDFEAERDHLFEAMDRPSIDGVNTFFVSLAARRANLKVALSGLGGDELFASYSSFEEIPRSVSFFKAFRRWRGFSKAVRVLSSPILKHFTSPKYAGLFEYGGTYAGAYLLRRGMFMPWELPELLHPDLVREGWCELQSLLRLEETLDGICNPQLKVSALEMNWYMRHQLLRDSDWAGMGHSLEIRVPFVDLDLLRAVAPLLASENPPTKRDMAMSAAPLITPELVKRPKTGFQIPVREWLRDESRQADFAAGGPAGRGLRGWACEVYSHFADPALAAKNRTSASRPFRRAATSKPAEALMLVSDAFGGTGGIAKFNRDFITALCASPLINALTAIPRIASPTSEPLPAKLTYATSALGGKSRFVRAVINAARQIRRKGSIPIIICGHINLLPTAIMARTICGGKVYLIVHGVEAWKQLANRIANNCLRWVNDFLAVSSVTRRRFLRWSGFRQDQGIILPNSVDLSVFTPGVKPRYLIDRYHVGSRTVLLTLGRLAEEERYKGFDEMLELLPPLIRDRPDILYMIVGDGPDRARLEQKAEQIGIQDHVIFTGRIAEAEKVDHYRLADAYVMPSSGEGFGIVFLEALACGIPVIGSKIDGSRDALLDGRLGLLVNPKKPAELRTAILQILAQKGFGVEERRTGVEYFSTKRFQERVFEIVELMTETSLVVDAKPTSPNSRPQIETGQSGVKETSSITIR